MAEQTVVDDEPTRQLSLGEMPERPVRNRVVAATAALVVVALLAVTVALAGRDDDEPIDAGPAPSTTLGQAPATTPTSTAPDPGGPQPTVAPPPPTTTPTTAPRSAPDRSRPPGMTYRPEAVWPETLAELDRLQAAVDQGHQPWRTDPVGVAQAYLLERGLPAPGMGPFRAAGDGAGIVDYSVAGMGGRVDLQRLANGTIWFVTGSRTATVPGLHVERQGPSLVAVVQAGAEGSLTVRAKQPGADWGPARQAQAFVGGTRTFTVPAPTSSGDVVVQVRVDGDGRAGLAESYLGPGTNATGYSALDSESRLQVDGLGPVRIGMTLEEARAASGLPMVYREEPYCVSYRTDGRPDGLAFVATNGNHRLDLIEVTAPTITTLSGIRVGSTLSEARRTYGNRLQGSVQDGRGKLVLVPEDPALSRFALALLVSDNRVAAMQAGLRAVVQSDEPCA